MRRLARTGLCLAMGAGIAVGCARSEPQPSILVFVYDTVRRDATSPYGAPDAATPVLARLAREGLVYDRAYANAPWTLPSHVSLLTGLLPSAHGVGVHTVRAPDDLVLLAERLADAGWDTRILSENPWVGRDFGLTQGFARVASIREKSPLAAFEAALDALLADRDAGRPLFLLVNVMDAHGPFRPHAREPFLPAGADVDGAIARYGRAFCRRDVPIGSWRPVVWGLYLGGVARADAKLGATLARLADEPRPLITVATADHGEHFGEHALTTHLYSVREPVIRIPLVVHGTGRAAGRIATPVALVNVHASMLGWAGLPTSGPAAPLPLTADAAADPVVVSEYFETARGTLAEQSELLERLALVRLFCAREERVRGDMRAVIRHPTKLIAFSDYPAELYDLARDAAEEHDLAARRPELAAELTRHLERVRDASLAAAAAGPEPSPETLERLRALGYLAAEDPDGPADPAP